MRTAAWAFAVVLALPGSARADEAPRLWEPGDAVGYLLAPRAEATIPATPEETGSGWNGSLSGGVIRALFGTYRTMLSSQDLPMCGFHPSCSRFSQRAVARCGFIQGALLSLDRLLRDHPLAVDLYPADPKTHLLEDDPERYCLSVPQ